MIFYGLTLNKKKTKLKSNPRIKNKGTNIHTKNIKKLNCFNLKKDSNNPGLIKKIINLYPSNHLILSKEKSLKRLS
jgi:hypothetical protein